MHNKATIWWYNIEFIHCEDVKINKDQTKFVEDIRKELVEHQINCPFYATNPIKQKNQRIVDTLEPVFSMKGIKFNRNLDSSFVQKLEWQLLNHPNNDHDDHSDCLAQWVWYFRKKPEVKAFNRPAAISSITNRPIEPIQNRRQQVQRKVQWYSAMSWRPL